MQAALALTSDERVGYFLSPGKQFMSFSNKRSSGTTTCSTPSHFAVKIKKIKIKAKIEAHAAALSTVLNIKTLAMMVSTKIHTNRSVRRSSDSF